MAGVFISYSHADREFARRIAADLRMSGVVVWIDEGEIRAGDPLIDHLRAAVAAADTVLVILSPAALRSTWVQQELAAALHVEASGAEIRIIPLLHKPCEVPAGLSHRVWVDFVETRSYQRALAQVVHASAGGPPPVWLTGKEAARIIKTSMHPRGALVTLSQQGVAQQYVQRSTYDDWVFADAKTGRSRVWIADYLDKATSEVYPFGLRDGRITEYPSATLQHEWPVIDFNFLDSDVAVPLAIKAATNEGGIPDDDGAYFVTTKLSYWRSKGTWAWTVSFFDVTAVNATCGVVVNARSGESMWYEQPPD